MQPVACRYFITAAIRQLPLVLIAHHTRVTTGLLPVFGHVNIQQQQNNRDTALSIDCS
jgi:hypothetical protein